MATSILLRDIRASFPSLFTLNEYEGRKSYRCSYIIQKGSENYKLIMAAIKAEAKAAWPDEWEDKLAEFKPQPMKYCVKDGDKSKYESTKGAIILTASRGEENGKPAVVGARKDPATGKFIPIAPDEGKVYSGVRCNTTVEIWAQVKNAKSKHEGMRCALINWQFFKHADSFGGAAPATDAGLPDLGYDDDDLGSEESGEENDFA